MQKRGRSANAKNVSAFSLRPRSWLTTSLFFFYLAFVSLPLASHAGTLRDAMDFYRTYRPAEGKRLGAEMGFEGLDREMFARALRVWPLIKYYAARAGVDPVVAFRVAATESRFNEREKGAVGEIGMYQLLPSTGQLLWKWHHRDSPEPNKDWKRSTPNQIYLAMQHLGYIRKGMAGTTSVRGSLLPRMYAIYSGGPTGLKGKAKGPWVMANLQSTKRFEEMVWALEEFTLIRVSRGPQPGSKSNFVSVSR